MAAASNRDGFVVASVGLYLIMANNKEKNPKAHNDSGFLIIK